MLLQLTELVGTYHRIDKETACISLYGSVGQLVFPNPYNYVAQLSGCRLGNAVGIQFCSNLPVVNLREELPRQPVSNVRDEETPAPVVLETALAIAIVALRCSYDNTLARLKVDSLYTVDNIFYLHSVGTNVLNGRCADVAGYERQVFRTEKAIGNTVFHYVVPLLATAAAQQYSVVRRLFFNWMHALDGRTHNRRRIVARQQKVASATNDKQRAVFVGQAYCYLHCLVGCLIFQKTPAPRINVERIMLQQAVVADGFHICELRFNTVFLHHLPSFALSGNAA